MEWVGTVVLTAWAKYQFGLAATSLFVGWRIWQFWDVTPKVVWWYQRVRDFVDTVESMNDAYEQIKI